MPNVSGTFTAPRPTIVADMDVRTSAPVDYTLVYNGLTRTYRTYTPSTLPGGARPLLVACHGSGGSGPGLENITGMDYIADANGFIVAYPDGISHHWSSDGTGEDDAGFIVAMVAAISLVHSIDPLRTYACGFSNGACMAAALGLSRPGTFAAIGLVAGDYTTQTLAFCGPAVVPMPVIQFHGDADPIWAYTGQTVRGVTYPPTEPSWTQWASWDSCATTATTGSPIPDPNGNGTSAVLKSYVGGANGSQSLLYKIVGGGHQWPGGLPVAASPTNVLTMAVNASPLIWSFVSAFTRVATVGSGGSSPFEHLNVYSPGSALTVHSPIKALNVRGT